MSNRLGGKQGTAYLGTNADQPPNWTFNDRDPNQYDTQNVSLGDLWMNTVTETVWVLVSLQGNATSRGALAEWIQFGGGTGDVVSLTGNTGGPVLPLAGNINVVGDNVGITITGNPATNTLTASLVGGGEAAQSFPTDSGTATPVAGILNINAVQSPTADCGSSVLFSAPGSSNTVLLNVTDANSNTMIGDRAGATGPIGTQNTSFGSLSSFSLTTGTNNTALGYAANFSLPAGSENIAIGNNAGNGWLTNESGNICIGSVGSVGDNHVLRIGSGTGGGLHQLLGAKISGIDGVNVGSVAEVVTMGTGGNADQLGTAVITAGTGISVTPGANTITIASSSATGVSAFNAYLSNTTISDVTGDGTFYHTPFDTVLFDLNGDYSTGTNVFTAPYTGIYSFNAVTLFENIDVAVSEGAISLQVTGTSAGIYGGNNLNPYTAGAVASATNPNAYAFNISVLVPMTAGDTAKIVVNIGVSTKTSVYYGYSGLSRSYFSGFLVTKT